MNESILSNDRCIYLPANVIQWVIISYIDLYHNIIWTPAHNSKQQIDDTRKRMFYFCGLLPSQRKFSKYLHDNFKG